MPLTVKLNKMGQPRAKLASGNDDDDDDDDDDDGDNDDDADDHDGFCWSSRLHLRP